MKLPILLFCCWLPLAASAASPAPNDTPDWSALLDGSARPVLQGNLPAAEQQLRALLASAPADAPTLRADILHRLQFVLRSEKRYAEALTAAREALQLRRQALGDNDLQVAESQQAYARLLEHQGELPAAEQLLQEALQIREKLAGGESLPVAETSHSLGMLYQRMRQPEKAADYLGRALVIRQKQLPPDHADTLYTQARLGAALQQLKEYERAIGLLEDVLTGEARRGNGDGLHAALVYRELAYCYHYQRRFAEAENYYRQALNLLALNVGQRHYAYAVTLQALGWLYISDGRDKEGQALLDNAKSIIGQGGGTESKRH